MIVVSYRSKHLNMPRLQFSENTSIWLNAIRGVAAQIVVISHAFQIFYSGEPAAVRWSVGKIYWVIITIAPLAQQAVVAFFVISGWLVGGKLLNDMIGQRFDLRKYIIDRITRLWIVLIPALVITMALDQGAIHLGAGTSIIASRPSFYPACWHQVDPWSLNVFLSNTFFSQMITSWQFGTNLSLWSLSNEFWYYFLFPVALGVCLAPSGKMRIICLLIVVMIGSFFLASSNLAPSFPIRYIFYFLIWSIAAVAALISRKAALVSIGVIALLTVAIFSTVGNPKMLPTFKSDLYSTVFILFFLRFTDQIPSKWLSRSAKFFSSYSYSLYLIHLPVLVFLMSFDPALSNRVSYSSDALIRFVVYVAIANLVAFGLSLVTERNTARIKSAIFYKLNDFGVKTAVARVA